MTEYALSSDSSSRIGALVLNRHIDALDWDAAIGRILGWARDRQSRRVCLCNVHSAVTALKDEKLATALDRSDLVLPDGAPVAWLLRQKGFRRQTRIAGPDLMAKLCEVLQQSSIGCFLFGSSAATLQKLRYRLEQCYPNLRITGALSPEYGDWSEDQERDYIETINRSGAGIIFVGLGCPRQEIWMAERSKVVRGVMLGVGAAFDFHAGTIERAPSFMRRTGLEWLHRLLSEPKRLWRRYLITNSYFIWFAVRDLIASRLRW